MQRIDHINYITSARKCYNDAILSRDVDLICSFLTFDYHVLTGRGVQSQGIEAQRQRWQATFLHDPITVYRRRTRKVYTSSLLKDAEELGNWVGKYTLDKKTVFVAGVYSAKWQRQADGLWLIQAEAFTTLRSVVY